MKVWFSLFLEVCISSVLYFFSCIFVLLSIKQKKYMILMFPIKKNQLTKLSTAACTFSASDFRLNN